MFKLVENSIRNQSSMDILPHDVFQEILLRCDETTKFRCSLTCTWMGQLIGDILIDENTLGFITHKRINPSVLIFAENERWDYTHQSVITIGPTDLDYMTRLTVLRIPRVSGLTQATLMKFTHLLELDVSDVETVTSVTHMKNLERLRCSGYCGIDQAGITGLVCLRSLDADDNEKIVSVVHMTRLKELDACRDCGIDQAGLVGLDLIRLNIRCNSKIRMLTWMTRLDDLDCSSSRRHDMIGQEGIAGLNVKRLVIDGNDNIIDVSWMTRLEELSCTDWSGITQQCIEKLNLIRLTIDNNSKISSVKHMTRLEHLSCNSINYKYSLDCGLAQAGIEGLNLISLSACGNSEITSVGWMTRLESLDCSCLAGEYRAADENDCGIDQAGIEGLNLKFLNASNNNKLTSVTQMSRLEELDVCCSCGIGPDGISGLNIKKLYTDYNSLFHPEILDRHDNDDD